MHGEGFLVHPQFYCPQGHSQKHAGLLEQHWAKFYYLQCMVKASLCSFFKEYYKRKQLSPFVWIKRKLEQKTQYLTLQQRKECEKLKQKN